jgi:hypothetical protein
MNAPLPSLLVVSGGTGCNAICPAFGPSATYVLPVSDDGGSSSEIIRVLGGPSIGTLRHGLPRYCTFLADKYSPGDIRSRLVRLIPDTPGDQALSAIRRLVSFRIPVDLSDYAAREVWRDIVEGKSSLWEGIPLDRKETIRGAVHYFSRRIYCTH